jgi:microcystin-dependent protein
LKANGAVVSRSVYAALFSAIGTTFGAGDGSTTFGLPDLRGEFIRGWDDGRGVDSGRVFGSSQLDQFQNHGHRNYSAGNTPTSGGAFNRSGNTAPGTGLFNDVSVGLAIAGPLSPGGVPRAGLETRPRNLALLACIKF